METIKTYAILLLLTILFPHTGWAQDTTYEELY